MVISDRSLPKSVIPDHTLSKRPAHADNLGNLQKEMAYFTVLFARGQPIQIIPVNYLQTDTKRGLPLMFQFFNWPLFYCSTNLEMKGEIIFLGHVVISLKKDLKPITLSNFEVADLYFLRNFKGEE